MTALVSILVPAYNCGRWLGATLESALAQDWSRKEVIVVDDGSRDHTLAVANSFSARGVRVVTQANAGASAARNRALSLARGDYIQWLDGDDLLAPDKLSRQMQVAAASSDEVLLSGEYGEFYGRPERAEFRPHGLWCDLSPVEFLLLKFSENLWMNPAVWLVSRRLAEAAGPWDTRLSLDDDGEYFARVIAAAGSIRFVPGACMYYRRGNVGSLSRSNSAKASDSLLLSMRRSVGHLLALEDSPRARRAALQLLQTAVDRTDCFWPDRADALRELEAFAAQLGGKVSPAQVSWKYRPIRSLFGWSAARSAKAVVANVKLLMRARYESLAAERH